jgi:MFS family permease
MCVLACVYTRVLIAATASYVGTSSVCFVFGFASAFAPSWWAFALCRFLVGIGLGASSVAFSLFAECVPVRHRGVSLIAFELWWSVGTITEVLLAWLALAVFRNWRLLVALSALPMGALLLLSGLVAESPRYFVVRGEAAAR